MRPYVNPFDINNFTIVHEIPANPAVATNFVGAAPVNARSLLSLISLKLITDANVANRFIELQLNRGVNATVFAHAFYTHIASKTYKYIAFAGNVLPSGTVYDTVHFPLPDLSLFLEGDSIQASVLNVQVGDQLSDIRLIWKVWPYEQ